MSTRANKSAPATRKLDRYFISDNPGCRVLVIRQTRRPRLWGWRCLDCDAGGFPATEGLTVLGGINSAEIAEKVAGEHKCEGVVG